ncbi:MAG: hypothetical protein R2757_12445 [Draconibacterium sp.]
MKKMSRIFTLCILFTGFFTVNAIAQEANTMPQNFLVMEEFVEPANMQAFWQVQQKAVDLWHKYELDLSIYTYRTDESSFYWIVPIRNFGGIDEVFKKANEVTTKMKGDGFDGDKEFRELSTTQSSVIHWSEELSYHPNGVRDQADNRYCEWLFVSLLSGHEKEAAEAVKAYKTFFDSIDESDDWDCYTVMLGYDSPMWVFMWRDKSALAMREHDKELYDKYKDKLHELYMGVGKHVRKTESRSGWFMPEWSLYKKQ